MTKFKLITGIVVALAVLYFGDRAYNYIREIMGENGRLHTELVGQQEKYKQLSAYAAKLEVDYQTQAQLKAELESKFKDEESALQGQIKVLSNATFLIREKARESGSSDLSYQGDGVKYLVNEIRFKDGPPVGYVLIFDDGRVVSKIYNHEIDVNQAITQDEDTGRYSIVAKADYVLKSPSINTNGEKVWTNQPYPLKITGGTAFVDPTERDQFQHHFMLWAPHLNGGMSLEAGANGATIRPTVDFSIAGYGVTRNDLDWKFAQVGVDIDTALTDPGFHVTPFSYRFWPSILTNTYVGPAVGWTKSGPNLQLNLNLTF